MKDTDLRSLVLQVFYDRRRQGLIQVNDGFVTNVVDVSEVCRICDQLSEHGLIEWKPTKHKGCTVTGFGKITAFGIDVIESEGEASPIKMTFPITNINISDSPGAGVIAGNYNQQTIQNTFDYILRLIEESNASDKDKREAKSLLKKFLEHPVTAAVIGALTGRIIL